MSSSKWISVVFLIGACTLGPCLGQRGPPLPQNFQNPNQQLLPQNVSGLGGPPGSIPSMQAIQQQQRNDELANIKDESIKRVLLELSTLQTPSQLGDTMARVAALVGPLFVANYEARKDQIATSSQGRSDSSFPQRLLSAVTDIQGEEVKALVLQKSLDSLHASDFAFLPLAIQYGLQEDVMRNLSGTKLASVVKVNPGDTVIASKVSEALVNGPDQQIEFLQSVGTKLLPGVQSIIMTNLLSWWGDPHTWKDRQLNLLVTSGSPLLAYTPQTQLQSLDDELADRFVTMLGETQDIGRTWWRKPMSVKKSWFELAKGARYFGAVHEWSFRRMQKLSFLLEGASPEDLELIPPIPEIKQLVISNHYTELQARVVFDAFYNNPPLSQEDLQEFQFHVLDLIPSQLQRFDFADSFGTLDEMMAILDHQSDPSYPTILQISYFMWPIINSTNSAMSIAPPSSWQKRELSQLGKLFFLLPKSVLSQIKPDLINWDSTVLSAIRSSHLSMYQIWRLTSQILPSVDERLKPDYIFMIPSPFQKGIPSTNISQALLGTTTVRPEVLRALVEETSGMLISQKSVILQRITSRLSESIVIRMMIGATNPSEMFDLISPRLLTRFMPSIIKTITEMPETGRFGLISIQTKLLPKTLLSIWLKTVRDNSQQAKWTAEDLLGRSTVGSTNELNYAIMGLTCRDIDLVDAWDILSVIMHYRHELYTLRRFDPTLVFNANLRSCVLTKFVQYMKQKQFLDGDDGDGHVLTGITQGEIDAIGGEIISFIPTPVLEQLDPEVRKNLIKEIGKLEMHELFSLVSLKDLHWYGSTLFTDIQSSGSGSLTSQGTLRKRRRRQSGSDSTPGQPSSSTNSTDPIVPTGAAGNATNSTEPSDGSRLTPLTPMFSGNVGPSITTTAEGRSISFTGDNSNANIPGVNNQQSNQNLNTHEINLESLNSMGTLLCYTDNLFDNPNWPRSLLKDVLEAKTSAGEKTCCLPKALRDKWFQTLQAVYGSDTSSWNEFDLTAIGDLLITLPEQDLLKIGVDSLGKATTPIMRQSAFSRKITIPGQIKPIQYITACVDELGNEGAEFMTAYKRLMKRIFQASQWMVNNVKTTQELIRDGVGRTGRIPRWAEHVLVKRQIPLSFSADGGLAFQGMASTGTTPTMVAQPTTFAMQPQQFVYSPVASSPQFVSTMPGQFSMMQAQPQFVQSGGQMFATHQGMVYAIQPATSPTFSPSPVFDPTTGTATLATTTAGAGGASANSAGVAGGVGGGSFANANTNANAGNANGFAAGGSFSQNGVVDQSNANTNTFIPRGAGTQPQQQTGQPNTNVPPPGQAQPAGATQAAMPPNSAAAVSPQQQPGFPTPLDQQQQQQPNPNQPQQPNPNQQQQPNPNQQQQQNPNQQQQIPPAAFPTPNDPQQQQPLAQPASQQPQNGANPGQPQPQQPQGQSQTGAPPNQLQTRSLPGDAPPQQQPGQQLPPPVSGSVPSPQQQQPGSAPAPPQQQQPPPQPNQQQLQQQQLPPPAGAPQNIQNQQQLQPGQNPQNPQQNQGFQQQQQQQPGLGNLPLGRASDPNNPQQGLQQQQQTQQQFQQQQGNERVRSLNFGPLQDDSHNSEITCHGVKSAGPAAIGLTIEDLNKLSPGDLFDCVEPLGKIEWDEQIKSQIVSLLKQKLEFSQESINALTLIEMGDLITAFSSDAGPSTGSVSNITTTSSNVTIHSDVSMIDLTLPQSLDVLSILGQQVTDPLLLKALAEKFNQDNRIFPGFSEGIARPENLRIVVMSLGNVICGLSDKIVNSIFETDGSLFIDTSRVLGKLEGCSNEVLSTLAAHAIRPSNYGPPRQWSQEDVETVGVVFAGLKPDVIATLPPEAMLGLTSLAIRNIPVASISGFTAEQLGKISYSAARAFTPTQLNNFSPQQTQAIQTILQVQVEIFNVPVSQLGTTGRSGGGDDSPDAGTDAADDLVVRNVADAEPAQNQNNTSADNTNTGASVPTGIGGRSRDGSEPVVVIAEETTPTGDPSNTNSSSPNPPTSSASSSKLALSSNFMFTILLVTVMSVIKVLN